MALELAALELIDRIIVEMDKKYSNKYLTRSLQNL